MLRRVGIGARDEHAEARDVRERRPHLLTVDHPLVTVAIGPGRKTRDVAARTGFAEELAPDLFAGEERTQVPLLLHVAAVGDDGRRTHAVADGVAPIRTRRIRLGEPRVHDVHQPGREAEASVALREVHPREPEVELRTEELDGRSLRGIVLGEQLLAEIENQLVVSCLLRAFKDKKRR